MTVENISISVRTNADKAASKLSSLVSAMENVKKAADNMVEGTGDISVSISRAAKRAEKEFEPLSSEMQKTIKDANKYQVLVHKAADASVKMEKAFEKGSEAAAWREREKEINATTQAQREFLKNQPKIASKPVSSEIQEFLTNANAIDLLKFRIESLNAEMQKAFQSGDANKAANYRQQIINATAALHKQEEALKGVEEQSKKTEKHHSKLLASIKRIAMYRMLRTILKEITQGFNEGLKNAYHFSKGINGSLAASLDNLATKSLTMKNQMGAAFGALLQAIMPIIMQIVSAITALMQALSALFAAVGGGQYLIAKDTATAWDKATGAANKYKNTILGFDEINRLDDPNSGGGGKLLNFKDMFEEGDLPGWAQKIKEILDNFKNDFGESIKKFKMRLKFNIGDVLFNWENLNGEEIAKKVIVALAGLCGAVAGFVIGGVPGAVKGTLLGVGLGLTFDSIIFDNDGEIGENEILSMVCAVAGALAGGAIGFAVGGVPGAAIGVLAGAGLGVTISALIFGEDGEQKDKVLKTLIVAMSTLAGGVIGFMVGGPLGAVIGATVGAGVSLEIVNAAFAGNGNKKEMLTRTVVSVLLALAGGAIGFVVGGPLGALIGVAIGAGVSLVINNALFAENGKTMQENILRSLIVVLGALVGGAIGFVIGGPLGAVIGATIGIGVTLVATNIAWDQGSAQRIANAGTQVSVNGFSHSAGKFASGGVHDLSMGSLFVAGEAGAELVTNMGNGRTGVTNVEQMEAAVANGNTNVVNAVYAMANMIVRAVNDIDPDITLDGESLADKMYHYNKQAANRYGAAMVT